MQIEYSVLVPTITNIVNLSLSSGQCHFTLKQSTISPLLKKPNLDKDKLSNYRPISNLSLVSKTIQHVKARLTEHLTSSNLLNPHQSAYIKHHSTVTALLCIHDHLINASNRSSLGVSMWSNLVAPIRNSLGAMQQLPLAPVGADIRSNLEGTSSWELLRELKGAPTKLLEELPGCS